VLPQQVAVLVVLERGEVLDAELIGQVLGSGRGQDVAFQERHVRAFSRNSRHRRRDLSALLGFGIGKTFARLVGNDAQHDQIIAR